MMVMIGSRYDDDDDIRFKIDNDDVRIAHYMMMMMSGSRYDGDIVMMSGSRYDDDDVRITI